MAARHMAHGRTLVTYGYRVVRSHDTGLGATLMVLIRGRRDYLADIDMICARLVVPRRDASIRCLD